MIAADIVLPREIALPTVSPARGIVIEALRTADVAAKTSAAVVRLAAAHRRVAAAASTTLAIVTCAASIVMPAKLGTALATMAGGGVGDPPVPAWCPASAGRRDSGCGLTSK
ncbi:hypothetical protein [Lentzea jiangxiensis]|uniref:Uncharacterized protein n=1 Tax=Lentzea jiangxiensis TaxID=641025 RepID=A0A1H0LY28_9PSEU|nr:hypothetical protein [Lentzea jiangxiensis]SDO73035.1 hypothetical protein SAMN05421507_103498 [Lentzea jiangxiensis]